MEPFAAVFNMSVALFVEILVVSSYVIQLKRQKGLALLLSIFCKICDFSAEIPRFSNYKIVMVL